MTELGAGPLGDIPFDLCPLIVLSDALAARTDGNEPAQNLREGLIEGPLECSTLLLEAKTLLQEAPLSFARGTLQPQGCGSEIEQQQEPKYLEEAGGRTPVCDVGVNRHLSSPEDVHRVQET